MVREGRSRSSRDVDSQLWIVGVANVHTTRGGKANGRNPLSCSTRHKLAGTIIGADSRSRGCHEPGCIARNVSAIVTIDNTGSAGIKCDAEGCIANILALIRPADGQCFVVALATARYASNGVSHA